MNRFAFPLPSELNLFKELKVKTLELKLQKNLETYYMLVYTINQVCIFNPHLLHSILYLVSPTLFFLLNTNCKPPV